MSENNMYNPFNWDFDNNDADDIISGGGSGGGSGSHAPAKIDISLEQDGLVYTLLVNGNSVGTINIPEDQFLQHVEYDSKNKSIVFTMQTDEGEDTVTVSIADLISSVEGDIKDIEIQLANFETKENVNAIAQRVTVLENGMPAFATQTWVQEQGYLTEHQEIPPTNRAFKENWTTNVSVSKFCQDILADDSVAVGDSYLGELMCSGLPEGMINGEVKAEVLGNDVRKILLLTVTSTSLSPYHWELTYLNGHEYGWRAWMEDTTLANVATSGDYNDLFNTPSIPTKTSQLQNDSNFLTSHQPLTDYATKNFVSEKIADLINEAPETLDTLKELADAVEGNATLTELNVVKTKFDALLTLFDLTEAKVNNVIINKELEQSNNVTFEDGVVDDIIIPETTKTTTITASLDNNSELTLTSPKGVTVNNTSDEPTNLTVNAPAEGSTPTVTLKDGEFGTVTLQDASLTVSNDATVQNVVITEETTKSLTISAIFVEGATVTSVSSAPITVTNKNLEGEEVSIVLNAPNSTVTLSGGKWEVVDATVSSNTLIIKKAAKIQDLNVKRGNVVVEVSREEGIKNVIAGEITLGEECDTWLVVDHNNFAEARHNQLEDYYNNYPAEAAQDGETWPPFTASKFPWLVVNHNFDGNTKIEAYYQGELKVEWTPSAMVTREDGTQVNRTYGILSIPEEFNLPQFAETNQGSETLINPADITVKLVNSTITHKVVVLNTDTVANVFKSNLLYDGEYRLTSDVNLAKTLTTGVISNADVVWNLNGNNYNVSASNGAFLMRGSSKLEVKGEGTITNSTAYGVWISGGTGIINGGRIVADTHALYCEKGLIEVNDGVFVMANSDADKDANGNYRFLLNCLDKNYNAGTANIVVRGGKFYDFNPGDCAAEGEHTSFLAEGYESVESTEVIEGVEHKVYTVRKV